jgi:exosortase family protein XrtF
LVHKSISFPQFFPTRITVFLLKSLFAAFVKNLFKKYLPVIRFLLLFLGTYGVLTALYIVYVSLSQGADNTPDFITQLVSVQAESVLAVLGYEPSLQVDPRLPMMRIILLDTYVGNINEGCNAMSVMILFVSFIVAFAQKLNKTLRYILGGLALIYATNIIRIVILSIALYQCPESSDFLHDIVFPGIIYGMVFLLWLFWVRAISKATDEESI